MNVFLWVLAVVSLLISIGNAIDEGILWLSVGVASFAVLGGLAAVISRLGQIRDELKKSNDKMDKLFASQVDGSDSTDSERIKAESEKQIEEQRRIDEQKRREEQRKKEEEMRRRSEGTRICPHCGNETLNSVRFCPKCGNKL